MKTLSYLYIETKQLSTVEASISMRGGWMPPWVRSRDMVCGAREMVKTEKKKAGSEQAVVVNFLSVKLPVW